MKKITVRDLKDRIVNTTLSKNKKGNFVARKAFFYTNGFTAQKYADQISNMFPMSIERKEYNIEIVDKGEVWLPFKGGAPVNKQSHWYVEFKVIPI